MKIRLIESPLAVPRYRQVRLPTVAAEFSPYADVEINDENVEAIDFSPVDLVGFTAQPYNAPRAIRLSKKFRELGVPTIIGGPYATGLPEEALRHFDAVVAGEVEGLGERIAGDLARGKLGGVYRSAEPPRLAGRGLPRRDLQKSGKYYWLNFPIEFTRGCPHRCRFCFSPYAYPTFRTRALDDIARDLAQWDHGLVEAVDLNFAADRKHILEVCRLLEDFKGFGWYGEATLLSMDDEEVLKALEKSNCKQVFVGIESIDEAALAAANKSFNQVSDYRRIIRMMQDHGIFVHAGFMWGLDGASPESFEATARFCEETGIYLASTNIAAYYPGTAAHRELKEKGRLETEDLRDFDSVRVTVAPEGMTEEEVYDGARHFLKRFYSYRSIYKRSFQNANYRFPQLFDFWGLNLIYRAYFKMWGRQLGQRRTSWRVKAGERGSFPYVGGEMPLIYAVAEKEGRFFDWWYRRWRSTPRPASLPGTLLLALLAAGTGLLLFNETQQAAAARWPLAWPGVGPVLGVFVVATLIYTWLAGRLARAPAVPLPHLAGLALALLPAALCIFALPVYSGGWRFVTALTCLLLFLKGWSALRGEEKELKSGLRVASFILFFPTLDFDDSFRVNAKKKPLLRHFPLMLAGMLKLAGGFIFLPALAFILITSDWLSLLAPLGWLGRLLVLYLLLCGALEYLTAYWRMQGYFVPPPFGEKPFGPARPAALWRAWNRPFGSWLVAHVYRPLGGRERPLAATLAAFLASGLFFGAVLAPVVARFPWEAVGFFLAEGALVALDKKLSGKYEKLPAWAGHALYLAAVAVFLGFAPYLFALTDRIFI